MIKKLFCGECGNECDFVEIDTGIGAYEFWGAKENHSVLERVSDCCEADLFEDEELEQYYRYSVD